MIETVLFLQSHAHLPHHEALRKALAGRGIEIVEYVSEKITLKYAPEALTLSELESLITDQGLKVIQDKESRLVAQIKFVVKTLIQKTEAGEFSGKNSAFISREIGYNYPYLSRLFSRMENLSIERYTILQKIERSKTLLQDDALNLSEIAFRLGYSSAQYLSSQFHKVTGMTVSEYRIAKPAPGPPGCGANKPHSP